MFIKSSSNNIIHRFFKINPHLKIEEKNKAGPQKRLSKRKAAVSKTSKKKIEKPSKNSILKNKLSFSIDENKIKSIDERNSIFLDGT